MNAPQKTRRHLPWELLLVVLALLATASAYGYVNRSALQLAMANQTGEEELKEQIKGMGALALLRLTQRPLRTDPYVPIAHSGLSPYGINTFLEQEVEPEKIDLSLRLIAEAGFHWIRQEFPWEAIEIDAKGDFWDHKWDTSAWQRYDLIVERAEAHGLQVIARLDNPPAWSRTVGNAPGWELAPPDDYADYGDFVYAVVSRYKGRIRYYQIWNEPNIYPEWGDQPANPRAYVELLKVAYRRAKEADPDCVIIAAGLAQTTEETPPEFGPRNVSDLLFLERMYDAGLHGHFDIMGAQVYGLWTGPYDRRISRDRCNFARPQMLRDIMVRHGDGDKPIWATEVGWNSLPADSPAPANYGRVTPEQQAFYAVQAYQRAAGEWPWMGVMNYWFFRRPTDAERDQSWYYFRMFEPDFQPLPVYGAMAWLANQPPTLPIGYHQQDHWALHYEGPWQHLSAPDAVLGALARGDPGATLRFAFEGTDLELVLRDPRSLDQVGVLIDGLPAAIARTWAGPSSGSIALRVGGRLPDARHDVQLTVGQTTVDLDGLIVRRSSPPYWLAIPMALAGLVLLAALSRQRAS
jgi:hypothetical protein